MESLWSESLRSIDFFNCRVRLEIGLKSKMVEKRLKVYAIEDKTVVVVVASYRCLSRNPVRFKALVASYELFTRCAGF